MAEKRRKSNWYIYVITFAVCMALAVMLVSYFWDSIMPDRHSAGEFGGSGESSLLPDASNDMMILAMMAEMKAGVPDYFMIINYRPNEETVVAIPIKANTLATVGNTRTTLGEHYREGGSSQVLYAVQNELGVTCDFYVKFDKVSFVDMIDEMNTVTVNNPYALYDENDELLFGTGALALGGEELYNYMIYPNTSGGDDYQSVVQGTVIMSIVNTNLRNVSATVMQTYVSKLINTTDTNITMDDFTARQKALLYTSENSHNPAEYYIPYGTSDESGNFTLAENSVSTIKDRLGLND